MEKTRNTETMIVSLIQGPVPIRGEKLEQIAVNGQIRQIQKTTYGWLN